MTALLAQRLIAAPFLILGGWCLFFPGMVERLGFRPEYLHASTSTAILIGCFGAQAILSGLFAYYSVRLAWVSRAINDMSTSSDATPLWIPQMAMAVGTVILCIAFVDEWVLELRRRRTTGEPKEALHNE